MERVIQSLSKPEREVLKICAKLDRSPNYTFTETTIRKKLPRPFKDSNIKEIMKSLANHGLVAWKRKGGGNWKMTPTGLNISHYYHEKQQEERYGMRILSHGLIFL